MPAGHDDGRPAGEGLGRTARMDVPEESDSGIASEEPRRFIQKLNRLSAFVNPRGWRLAWDKVIE